MSSADAKGLIGGTAIVTSLITWAVALRAGNQTAAAIVVAAWVIAIGLDCVDKSEDK